MRKTERFVVNFYTNPVEIKPYAGALANWEYLVEVEADPEFGVNVDYLQFVCQEAGCLDFLPNWVIEVDLSTL